MSWIVKVLLAVSRGRLAGREHIFSAPRDDGRGRRGWGARTDGRAVFPSASITAVDEGVRSFAFQIGSDVSRGVRRRRPQRRFADTPASTGFCGDGGS